MANIFLKAEQNIYLNRYMFLLLFLLNSCGKTSSLEETRWILVSIYRSDTILNVTNVSEIYYFKKGGEYLPKFEGGLDVLGAPTTWKQKNDTVNISLLGNFFIKKQNYDSLVLEELKNQTFKKLIFVRPGKLVKSPIF